MPLKTSSPILFYLTIVLHALLYAAPTQAATLYYIKSGKVFEILIERNASTGHASCLYNLYKGNLSPGSCYLLGRNTVTGSILIYCQDDTLNQGVCSIHNAHLTPGVPDGNEPALSPDGNEIVFNDWDQSAIYNQLTKRTKTIADGGDRRYWAKASPYIAVVGLPMDDDWMPVRVINMQNQRVVFKRSLYRPSCPFISPLGSYAAVVQNTDRLVLGDTIIAVLGNSNSPVVKQNFTPKGFMLESVEDWSLDEKWILWDWRVPDPSGDGSWIADNVGLTSVDGKFRRDLGRGENAKFSADGKIVFFLRPDGDTNTDLYIASGSSWTPHLIVRNVDSYIVY